MRFRYIVTAVALSYIAWALADHHIWSNPKAFEALWRPNHPWLLSVLAAGLPLNLGLETAKWHALTATSDTVSYTHLTLPTKLSV